MKTIGIIGGMSFESTLEYYRLINEGIKHKLGGLNSAKIILYSVNFEEIESLQRKGQWQEIGEKMSKVAKKLETAGADFILITSNTIHKVADQVSQNINIPLLHIAEATSQSIKKTGLSKLALLGTIFTMEEEFYRDVLSKNGIDTIIPNKEDCKIINRVIFDELCRGSIKENSKKEFLRIIDDLIKRGAEGLILGCTEIPLLINSEDISIPVFDTEKIHVEAAMEFALENRAKKSLE